MIRNYVEIALDPEAQDAFAGFPFEEGQYLEAEIGDSPDDDSLIAVIWLGDRSDTTTAQEQFLNTNTAVREYLVRNEGLDEE